MTVKIVKSSELRSYGINLLQGWMFGRAHVPVRIESDCKYVVAEKVMMQFVAELTAGKNE